jgi:hypothetical protein
VSTAAGWLGGAEDPGRALPHSAGQHGRQQGERRHHHPPVPGRRVEGDQRQGWGSGFNRVSGSGSRRAKMTHKSIKIFYKFMF